MVLLSVAAFAAANMRVIDPLLVQLSVEFGVTVGTVSIATTLVLLANRVFVLVHGPFGDRSGKMPVMAIACLAAAGCCALSALATTLGTLAGMRFLTGVTSSAIIPLAIAWLSGNVAYQRRQATLARFLTSRTLGLMTGAAMGGALGDWLGGRAVFWVLAAFYVAVPNAIVALRCRFPSQAARVTVNTLRELTELGSRPPIQSMTDISSVQKFEPCDVLVVEDEFSLAETISQFLIRGGLRVRTAHGAASALRTASIAPPRVAIIDYQIPGMNGLELAATLRAELPTLQIILMSANNLHFDRATLESAGVKVFVNKPMPPGPLRQAVLRLLQA